MYAGISFDMILSGGTCIFLKIYHYSIKYFVINEWKYHSGNAKI